MVHFSQRSVASKNRPWCASEVGLSSLAHIMGVVVREMIMEMRMATERVTANSRKSRPTMPPINRIGMNTAIREMLMEMTKY